MKPLSIATRGGLHYLSRKITLNFLTLAPGRELILEKWKQLFVSDSI